MLPFRSGRAGIVGAFSGVLLLALLSCGVWAAEKKPAKPETKNPSPSPSVAPAKKPRPKPEEGVRDVPLTEGHDAKGLVLPDFDLLGHMRGKLQAGVGRRLDADNIEFVGVKFTTFIPETEQPNLEISMDKSVFNLKTQVLTSNVRSTVKRADFEVAGDTMKFEMLTRQGTLTGNVKMVVRGKARTPGEESE
ncbi:MAG: hypothetical protein ACJ8M4_04465 [Chthoniobacterales bacterium]